MSRYIDADALDIVYEDGDMTCVRNLDAMPTVDAVPVTRCAQCKWCEYPAHNSTGYACKLFDRCVKWDWFCADGKRKEQSDG